jgi:hypothetical protein
MTWVNLKYVRGKPMLTTDQLCEAGQYCVKLHHYYNQNYKTDEDIMVQYKEHVITFSDLYDLFTLDKLDISLMCCFAL